MEGGMEHAHGYNLCNIPCLRYVSYTVRYAKKLLNQIVYLFAWGFCMALKTGKMHISKIYKDNWKTIYGGRIQYFGYC